MDPTKIQEELAKKRQELGQRTADIPKLYSQYSPDTDPTVRALRSNQAEKLKELFAHDQQLADVYFQPQAAPAAPGEVVAQPEKRLIDPTIGMRAASTQTMATAGEIGDIINQIATRKDYLSTERDKALSVLDRMLAINDRETKALERQLDIALQDKKDKEDKRRWELEYALKKQGGEVGKADLTALFNAITGVQQKKEATTPLSTGKAKNKAELDKVRKQNPEATIDFKRNPDGSYSYAIRKPGQEFFGSEAEATKYEDIPSLIKQLGAATTAVNPKMASEVESIVKSFLPQTTSQYASKEEARKILRQNLGTIPKGTDPNVALRLLIQNHPELTVDEIQAEMLAFGF